MAERLRRSDYFDGAVFHAYHAYECAISAFLAARGVSVPPSHQGWLQLFLGLLDPTRAYALAYHALGYLSVTVRNRSL